MSAKFNVCVDDKAQIIIQRIRGDLYIDDFNALERATAECVQQLRDKQNICILVDARNMGRSDARTRKRSNESFEKYCIRKMALWGCSPIARVVAAFFSIAYGRRNIRTFATEKKAHAWLMS